MSDEQKDAPVAQPVAGEKSLAELLGVESIEEAKAIIAETRKSKADAEEKTYSEAVADLKEPQKKLLSGLFGDKKADQLQGLAALREAGFISPSSPPAKPRATLSVVKQPESAARSEVDHAAEYERLKTQNPIAARNYFLAHKHKILNRAG